MNAEPIKPKKKIFTKKRIIWGIVILAVVFVGYLIFKPKNNAQNILTDTVKKQDIKATVLATGQVVSSTDLQLSFKNSGTVAKIYVKEGDKVPQGQLLASLEQRDQTAAYTQAQGALAQAKANYEKIIAGASSEDIAVAQVTLSNAQKSLQDTKNQQTVLVNNAYQTLMNSGLTATPAIGNNSSYTATISGTYTGSDQGVYQITVYASGDGMKFQYSGLESGNGRVDVSPQPLGTRGLYIQFSSQSISTNNVWTVTIPNNQSSTYITNYNAYQSALQTQKAAITAAENTVASAQAALDLKKAQARPADVDAASAQILIAQGQVQAAQAALDNTVIRAPAAGTVTSVDIKVGELASALKEVLVLQDVGNLHVEANVSEANIAQIQPGQVVDLTFDALGPDRHFVGQVQTVNPASTLVSGVVNYLVKASMDNIPEIKPGMTANMTVLTAQKPEVLTVPQRAVIFHNDKSFVRVVDDAKKKTYHEVEVGTGLQADGGLVEIVSGLREGQEVVTYIKQ